MLTRDLSGGTPSVRPLPSRHRLLAAMVVACLALAFVPHLASSRGAEGRVARCARGLTLDADLRRTLAAIPPGQPLSEDQRTALAQAVVTEIDEADARFMFRMLVECLESDTAMPMRGARFAARRAALTTIIDKGGFDPDAGAQIVRAFDQVGPLYASDAIFAARRAQRQLVDDLTTAVIARDGNAMASDTAAAEVAPVWLAASDLVYVCEAANGKADDHDLCDEALARLRRQHTPCDMLTAVPSLGSRACLQSNRLHFIGEAPPALAATVTLARLVPPK